MFNIDQDIKLDGEDWTVINIGATTETETFLHCANKTRGRHQANGFNPAQIGCWVNNKTLETRVANG
tara:strand:- start:1679 stop:1879 length:201 start_codon:yes stop_codon:yes gene_type:complete